MTMIKGRVYQIVSRNLVYVVGDGRGFIGIREKFGSRYLFTEYPSTVKHIRDTQIDVPQEILIQDTLGTRDAKTQRIVIFDKTATSEIHPNGWWRYEDTNELAPDGCSAESIFNRKLFQFLDKLETEEEP